MFEIAVFVVASVATVTVAVLIAAGLMWCSGVYFNWSCPFVSFPPRWLTRRVWFRRRVPYGWLTRGWLLRPWNLFGNPAGEYWGAGVLQFQGRHLVAAINNSDHPGTVVWLFFVRVR